MLGNYQMHGDPTFPLDYINDEHRRGATDAESDGRQLWLRVQGIAFWPTIALVSLTPGVALLGAAGVALAWRDRPTTRWLVIAATMPVLYYAVRTTVFANFIPLARFMAGPLTVLLVFVWNGYVGTASAVGINRARRVVQVSVALALAIPLAVGWLTFRRDGLLEDTLRPVSPTSTNPLAIMDGAEFIRSTVVPSGREIVVDIDDGFLDQPLVFYGGLLQERVLRVREPADLLRVAREHPEFVVRFDRGSLVTHEGVRRNGRTLELGGAPHTYDEHGFSPPLHVYARRGDAKPVP
jgi:hypothetical protein